MPTDFAGGTAPSGSATSAKQDTGNTSLASIDTKILAADNVTAALANPTVGYLKSLIVAFNGTTWNAVKAGVTAKASSATGFLNAIGMGRYNASLPALTDGDVQLHQLDSLGCLRVTQQCSFLNQAGTTAGVLVKSGAGFLHSIIVNTPVVNGVITLYDNTAASGTKIATITYPGTLLSSGPMTVTFDIAFATGLELVIATGACDVTVCYR